MMHCLMFIFQYIHNLLQIKLYTHVLSFTGLAAIIMSKVPLSTNTSGTSPHPCGTPHCASIIILLMYHRRQEATPVLQTDINRKRIV